MSNRSRLADAEQICHTLNIEFNMINFATEYWDHVFQHFLQEYQAGRTPNPDILCNKEIKFTCFLDHAIAEGADAIATGHYANIEEHEGLYSLHKAADANKDQTYFLYALNQSQLSKSVFPLGAMLKSQVRQMAQQSGLHVSTKKDSTGICFIGEKNFNQFLNQFITAQPGNIETPEGQVMGTHQGLMFHTLGQRKGLNIGGHKLSNGQPWYVVGKKITDNILVIAQGHDHPLLFSTQLTATHLNWIRLVPPVENLTYHAKTRYRQHEQACTINHSSNNTCTVTFEHPQRAVTPGQSIVFYHDTECLGGGIIDTVGNIIYQH